MIHHLVGDIGKVNLYVFTYDLVISPRVLTRSERNFTRLRIWLAHRAYKSFPRGGACRFGPRSVLKLSPYTRAAEAANIQYIIRNTTIPVPHIQDVFAIERRTFIVMDYINAPELTFVNNLSFEQEEGIFSQLKDYISQMRSLQPPKHGRLEAVDGSGLYDVRLAGEPFPPFASVEEFHERLGHEVVLKSQIHSHMWSDFEAVAKRRCRLKFTHGDIAPRNILVKNGRIVAIIDWESAGWYPEYWEYTRWASSNYTSSQKWHDMRDVILDRYPDELRVDEYLETVFTRL
jgi:tRNA A-37 threonylcarbamoyl transferase component Bud32